VTPSPLPTRFTGCTRIVTDTSPDVAAPGPSVRNNFVAFLNASARSPRGDVPVKDKGYLDGKSLIWWPPGVSSLWSPISAFKLIVTDTSSKVSVPRPAARNDSFAFVNASARSPLSDTPVKDDGFDFDFLADVDFFIVGYVVFEFSLAEPR
jgi:hypothetical protein